VWGRGLKDPLREMKTYNRFHSFTTGQLSLLSGREQYLTSTSTSSTTLPEMGKFEFKIARFYNRHILLCKILIQYTNWKGEELIVRDLFKFKKPMMTLRMVQLLATVRSVLEDYEGGCTDPDLVCILQLKDVKMSEKERHTLLEKLETKLNLDRFIASPVELLTEAHPDAPRHTSIFSYSGYLAKHTGTLNLKRIIRLAAKEIDPGFGESVEGLSSEMGLPKLKEVEWMKEEDVKPSDWVKDTEWVPYTVKQDYEKFLVEQAARSKPNPARAVSTSLELHTDEYIEGYNEVSSEEEEKKICPKTTWEKVRGEKSKNSSRSPIRPPSPRRFISPVRSEYRTGANLEPVTKKNYYPERSPRSPLRAPLSPRGARRPRARSESVFERPPKRQHQQVPYKNQVLKIVRADFEKHEQFKEWRGSPKEPGQGYIVKDKKGNNACGNHVFMEKPGPLMEAMAKFMCSRDAFPQVREGFVAQRFELTETLSDMVQLHLLENSEEILSQVQTYMMQMKEDIKTQLHPIWENFTHLENKVREMQSTLANKEVQDLQRHNELLEFNVQAKGWIGVNQGAILEARMLSRHIDANLRGLGAALGHPIKLKSEFQPMTNAEGRIVEEYVPSGKMPESVPVYVPGEIKKQLPACCEQEKNESVSHILEMVHNRVISKGAQKELVPVAGDPRLEKKKKSARSQNKENHTMEALTQSLEDELQKPQDKLTALVAETTKDLL